MNLKTENDAGFGQVSYRNPALPAGKRAELLLAELTLEEKMAQVNCVFPFDKTYLDDEWIRSQIPYGIGEVSTLEMRRIGTLEEAAAWTRHVQEIVMEHSPHHIPAIFHMEGLCGAFIQDTASFPSGIARGAGFDPELEEKIGACVASQELACGITHILAPVLDISRDSRMGRQGEAYGEDPSLAAALGSAYARGAQAVAVDGRRIHCTAKHFLGFHNSAAGIHGAHSETTERTLREIYGKPFQAAITEAGLKGIMPCYCSIDGEPTSVSRKLLTGLLREEMGFRGLCISDYGGVGNSHTVHHIGETMAEVGEMALEAGMDIEMPSPAGYGEELRQAFSAGIYPTEFLDRAVLRVLTAKFEMGLFEHPFALRGAELAEAVRGAESAYGLPLQSAREALVLLKNDGTLPIDPKTRKKIAVIGPHAANARFFFGGYTHLSMMESIYAVANSIAGVAGIENTTGAPIETVPGTNIQLDREEKYDDILRRQQPDCPSLLEQLQREFPEAEIIYSQGYQIAGDDTTLMEAGLQAVREADLAILTLGGRYGTCSLASMGEGIDSTDINLPHCQDEFLRRAAEIGKPMVGIHFGGRPISSDAADRVLNSIVEAWTLSECGARAICEVLSGAYNPGGRMPVSTAYNAGQIPIYYNHPWGSADHQSASIGFQNYLETPHTPRYPFGYGLSYSEFRYGDLTVSREAIGPDDTVEIGLTLENVSSRAGDEVVQLYLSDEFASRTHPVMELAGFRRVHLDAGEKRKVRFLTDPSQMAFLDKDMRWKIEKGKFAVMVGASSADIRLRSEFTVTEDRWIDGRTRRFYAVGDIVPAEE